MSLLFQKLEFLIIIELNLIDLLIRFILLNFTVLAVFFILVILNVRCLVWRLLLGLGQGCVIFSWVREVVFWNCWDTRSVHPWVWIESSLRLIHRIFKLIHIFVATHALLELFLISIMATYFKLSCFFTSSKINRFLYLLLWL